MKRRTSNLIRWAGLSAMVARLIFAVVGLIPRRYPVALGGRPAWLRCRGVPSVCAASAGTRTASGGAGWVRSGVAGICDLV
jgi:hypothetical protein